MSKRVLVPVGSIRKNGSTDRMAEEFTRDAQEAGHHVEKIYLKDWML